ncbi:two-component sensor histidine kinase [Paenibacillus sp. CAA11]|uniref:sensor histidine kinase n=1 Tax=Paenibacillus sp. CAA11 TaxID=1532905 RepID=UPI000D3341E4|nr:histidine kinase [Paenibacillus sp. CAA11]AWB44426.1 two-component sensor histidine kinase [Paenibacillus sp. CAA11]
MTYKQIKWLILIVPTLIVGLWEVLRHQLLMPYISMDLGNYITPCILFVVSITLLNGWFKQLERMQRELQEARLAKIQLEARDQLARELHDGIAQSLFLLAVKIDKAERQSASESGTDWNELRKTVHEVNRYVRQAISDLRVQPESILEASTSMQSRIQKLEQEISAPLQVNWKLPDAMLTAKEQVELLAMIREAVMNVRKHAEATKLVVSGDFGAADQWMVKIEDNGKGMLKHENEVEAGKFGLTIMRERARVMGWEVTIQSEPGDTVVCILGKGGRQHENARTCR